MSTQRRLALAGMAAVLLASLGTVPASAETCIYVARTPDGNAFASGRASAGRQSTACKRARRQCNRQLGWKVVTHGQPSGLRPCTELRLGHADEGGPSVPKRTNGKPSKPRPNTSKPGN